MIEEQEVICDLDLAVCTVCNSAYFQMFREKGETEWKLECAQCRSVFAKRE